MPPRLAETFRRVRLAPLAFFCGPLVVLLVLGRTALLRDPGTYWHTAVGEDILSSGHLPVVDTYSHTLGGQPWIAHQWLGECAMAVVSRYAGFDGLILLASVLLAWLLSAIAWRGYAQGLHWILVSLLLALVFSASAYSFHVRPHIASIALIGLLFGLLCDIENDRRHVGRLWWLVPLMVLWSNLHGGALGGLCTLALVVAGWLAWECIGWESPTTDRPSMLTAVAVVVVCAMATLVNPYGPAIPQTWGTIMNAGLPQLIVEHAPLSPGRPEGQMVLLLGGVYLFVLAGIECRPRVTWLIPLVWLVLTLTRIRHAPLFAVIAAISMVEILPRTRWWRGLVQHGYITQKTSLKARTPVLMPLMVSAMLLFTAIAGRPGSTAQADLWARPDPQVWPAPLLPELHRIAGTQPEVRLFNEMHFGGFLIANAPSLKTFIDDRCELFGEEFLREYAHAEHDPEIVECWIAQYGIAAALTRPGSGFDAYFEQSPNWSETAHCDSGTVYVLAVEQRSNLGGRQ